MAKQTKKAVLDAIEQKEGSFAVMRNGLHAATVVPNGNCNGWRVFYRGTGRSNGRKSHPTPEAAIRSFWGRTANFIRLSEDNE